MSWKRNSLPPSLPPAPSVRTSLSRFVAVADGSRQPASSSTYYTSREGGKDGWMMVAARRRTRARSLDRSPLDYMPDKYDHLREIPVKSESKMLCHKKLASGVKGGILRPSASFASSPPLPDLLLAHSLARSLARSPFAPSPLASRPSILSRPQRQKRSLPLLSLSPPPPPPPPTQDNHASLLPSYAEFNEG